MKMCVGGRGVSQTSVKRNSDQKLKQEWCFFEIRTFQIAGLCAAVTGVAEKGESLSAGIRREMSFVRQRETR